MVSSLFPCPREAQFAPAFAACVGDFDGDGLEDVFLSQNFFATEPKTPRCDAGRGLWLRGDGHGGLQPVPGQESGIKVYGEQRGAALCDYDHDGRVDLVVTQNGNQTRLFHNVGAKPGLRVRLAGPAGQSVRDRGGGTSRLWRTAGPGARSAWRVRILVPRRPRPGAGDGPGAGRDLGALAGRQNDPGQCARSSPRDFPQSEWRAQSHKVSGARHIEIHQIPVTSWRPLDNLYAILGLCGRLRRSPVGPHSCSAWGPGGREKEKVSNRLASCLQLPCNYGPAPALLRCCLGATPAAERPRLRADDAQPRVMIRARHPSHPRNRSREWLEARLRLQGRRRGQWVAWLGQGYFRTPAARPLRACALYA